MPRLGVLRGKESWRLSPAQHELGKVTSTTLRCPEQALYADAPESERSNEGEGRDCHAMLRQEARGGQARLQTASERGGSIVRQGGRYCAGDT